MADTQQLPLVSAIMIFLNEERFIQEAIESVFAQTYENWELLLVDDGSTDRSRDIAQQWAATHPDKVRYLEHEGHSNRGPSASRNLGVSQAQGTYVSYIDGDDIWLPNKLERQVALLQQNPEAVMVYGPLQVWHSWTGNPDDQTKDCLYGVQHTGKPPFSDTVVSPPNLLTLFLRHKHYTPSGVLIERKILTMARSEESFRGNYEDDVVQVKVCLNQKVFTSSESWYKYRIHPDSCCRVERRQGKSEKSRFIFLTWVEQYLTSQGETDQAVWAALREALFPYRYPRLYGFKQGGKQALTKIQQRLKQIGKQMLPSPLQQWLRSQ